MMLIICIKLIMTIAILSWMVNASFNGRYTKERILELREEVRSMFQHAYEGYLNYASDYDELRPLTCDGIDTWGSYSLSLIDALDTLGTMGNFTEFRRVATLLEQKMDFNKDINVSVFETNIRIVGGLIGAHLMSKRAGVPVEAGWPCAGPLLRLAENVARRLLPAFDTATGMPYGTVNLRYGVPKGETSVTCTAGIGTFLIEFGALSRLTGNPIYEEVALNAVYSLWEHRSTIGLFGNHIDVQTGRWTAQDAGIGAGVDSFYEYLVKAAILLNRPNLLEMFHEARTSIDRYLKRDDWYVWASMYKGQVTLPIFQSLEAYWPGVLSMIGDFKHAIRTLTKYDGVWKQYGFLPEFYNIPTGEATENRESYPLRPELAESAMYLYRATKHKFLLEVGENMVRSIECNAKTSCGYASIRNVITHEKDNRMESFFLAETTKYLYLLFDEENFLHNIGDNGEIVEVGNRTCTVHSGAYIFNTEAHPVDRSALQCCHAVHGDIFKELNTKKIRKNCKSISRKNSSDVKCTSFTSLEKTGSIEQISATGIDNSHYDNHDNNNNDYTDNISRKSNDQTYGLTLYDLNTFFNFKREHFTSADDILKYIVDFMKKFTLDTSQIEGLPIFERRVIDNFGSIREDYAGQPKTLWQLYELSKLYDLNIKLMKSLGLVNLEPNTNLKFLENIFQTLNKAIENPDIIPSNEIEEKIFAATKDFKTIFFNTTAMQEFLFSILNKGSAERKQTFTVFLNDEEIMNFILNNTIIDTKVLLKRNIFVKLQRVLKIKYSLFKTLQEFENAERKKLKTQQTEVNQPADYKTMMLNVYSTISLKHSQNERCEASHTNTKIKQKSQESPTSDTSVEESNDSIWWKLLQVILRREPETSRSRKFDEKLLLERTLNSLRKYENIPQNYSVFTCPAPSYMDRFAYGAFYP